MIKPLTSLRFFFALAVFFTHIKIAISSENIFLNNLYSAVFAEGYVGVSFFFILSGFVLSYSYRGRIINKSITKKEFILSRIIRIYPLHFITLFLALPMSLKNIIISLKGVTHFAAKLFFNMFLVQSYIPNNNVYFSFNGPSWSISNELFFYLMFPFLIIFFNKIKKLYYIILLIMIIFLYPILILLTPANLRYDLFYINPIFRIIDFILGIYLFSFYEIFYKIKWFFRANKRVVYSVFEISTLSLFLIFLFYSKSFISDLRYSYYYWIPMSLIILVFAFQNGIISHFLSKNIFILLGEISFSFYLIHQIILRYLVGINIKYYHFASSDIALIIFALFISLGFSYLSFSYIEIPLGKYFRKSLL
jgi:peptidoglycan/LPS O-acetylase OafA/YrhL